MSLPPEVPQPVSRPNTQPASADQLENVKREMTGFERSTVRLAQIALCISILAAIFVCLQWWEMHEGGIDTHDLAVAAGKQADAAKVQSEQAKAQTDKMTESLTKTDALITKATEQATATNRLAEQAKRQANIAASTLEAQRRPWIAYDHINIPSKITKDSTVSNSLIYKNWGGGPALHVLHQYQGSQLCGTFPLHPFYNVVTRETAILLMPGQVAETGITNFIRPLTDEDMLAIKQPNCGLYLYARITYRDKENHRHWRHFCAKWDTGTEKTFLVCDAYNDGDEDYPNGKEP